MKKFSLSLLSLSIFSTILYAQSSGLYSEENLIIAMFILGVIGIITLFISSQQITNLRTQHKQMKGMQDNINDRHDKLLSVMTKHIQSMAQETVKNTHELATKIDHTDLNKIVHSESKLLGITSDLIEFLRLKSKKVEIINENFKLVNLLNDTLGILNSNFKGSEIELNYDIDNNIPNTLIGDTLNLNKILVNIFEFSINNDAKELLLKIYKTGNFATEIKLNFLIKINMDMDVEDNITLFNSKYNEDTKKYEGLDLFVAKELSLLMNGELIARNSEDKDVEFLLTIPFKSKKDKALKLNKELENKRVLVVDTNKNSTQYIKNIFLNLKYNTQTDTTKNFILQDIDLSAFDILVINNTLLTQADIKTIVSLDVKLISIGNTFTYKKDDETSPYFLNKPIHQESVYKIINKLYTPSTHKEVESKKVISSSIQVHRENFRDTPNVTLQRFSEFKGKKILLVEDNFINQKVLTSVLSRSEIEITIANHGQEALDLVNGEEKFDLVLMDINMPVMDGYTASQKIREDEKFNNLPIVSLTALTSPDEVQKMFNCGMNGYLAKPFYKERLFTVFSIFLANEPVHNRRDSDRKQKKKVFDGLNIETGIQNTDNSDIFYKEVLIEFKDAYANTDKTFKKLIEDQRVEQLRLLCLDIKGLSGAIGAIDMHDLATEVLQRLIFKKYELLPNYIKLYQYELEKLNKSINEYLL